MNLNNFEKTTESEFEINSGKVLIASPFYLGYTSELEDHIMNLTRFDKEFPVTMLPNGFLYYNVCADGEGARDGKFIVYNQNSRLHLQDIMTYKQAAKHKLLFGVHVEICTLLVGDADVFSLNHDNWAIEDIKNQTRLAWEEIYGTSKPEEEEDFVLQLFKLRIRDITESYKQVTCLKKGRYVQKFDPNKRIISLSSKD